MPAGLYVPAGHGSPLAMPEKGQKVPGGQSTHVPAFAAPIVDDAVPAGHGVHWTSPTVSLYVPGGHMVHGVAPEA